MSKRDIDLTKGNLLKNIILFSIPVIATNLLQQLFNVADVVVVGQFCGDISLGAVSSNGAIISLVVSSFIGISIGLNIVMSRAIGKKDYGYASKALHTAMLFAVTVGILVGIIGFFCTPFFIKLVKLDSLIVEKAERYLSVYFLGAPALMIYNFGASSLQARGNSRSPLLFMVISGVINLLLNLLFVLVFNLDVLGVALATVISEYLSMSLCLLKLFRSNDELKFYLSKIKINHRELKAVLSMGVPSMFNAMFFSISNLIIQTAVNEMGPIITTANSVASNIESFIYLSVFSFSTTAVTTVSQNLGAENFDRIKKAIFIIPCCVLVVGTVIGLTVFILDEQVCRIFTSDTEVIKTAIIRLKMVSCLEVICGIMDAGAGCLRGFGKTATATIVTLIGACLVRVVWVATVFKVYHTLFYLYISYPISWTITSIVHYVILYFTYKNKKHEYLLKNKI